MASKLDTILELWERRELERSDIRYLVGEWLKSEKAQSLIKERGYLRVFDILQDIPHYPSEEHSVKVLIGRTLVRLGWRRTKDLAGTIYRRPVQICPV